MSDRDEVRAFAGAIYPLGVLLSVLPLVDMAMRASPFRTDDAGWRFAALGTLFGNVGTILIGFAIIGAVAAYRRNVIVLRVLSVAALLAGVAVAALLVLFALDVLQVRKTAPEGVQRAIASTSVAASVAGVLGAIALLSIGVGAWVAARNTRRLGGGGGKRADRPVAPSPMVVQSAMTGTKTK